MDAARAPPATSAARRGAAQRPRSGRTLTPALTHTALTRALGAPRPLPRHATCHQEEKMEKSVEAVRRNFGTVRTGRANTAILDRIQARL